VGQLIVDLQLPIADFARLSDGMILGPIVMAFFFTLLCTGHVATGGAGARAMLGILVGLLYAGPHLISFAVQPVTVKILSGWIVSAVIQFIIAGAIVRAIHKPNSLATR
jgi:hypothetical protein